ncbi:MAG: sulfotransferase [Alphaproteobacteria bacterium]|jgi:hypothetical protein|nr:sulfotransferase [Alphaproteobacteria bacterium]MDP6517261.1 sulfotransferase [Alphaproteobacteria bacterium]
MAMEIIDFGLGRTGTMSLKLALEQLGFGPCHHMEEVVKAPGAEVPWLAAANGETVDWDAVFAGYRSTVDWPTARFWREILDYYPKAKIILTTRDPDRWHQSISQTIHMVLEGREKIPNPVMRRIMDMAHRIVSDQTFHGRLGEAEYATEVFRRHNDAVIAAVPAERLLVMEVSQGWEPLCRFLGCPVPDGPFPHANTTKEFWELIKGLSSD